jgi:beta-1,4-mannosyl-glycoprotein beta-1,4-N-acetylglucosaminyltransferase
MTACRVFDGFTFFNELDLLELRLNELAGHVDFFVLVEAPMTFQGKPKPLFYAENQARFAAFRDKIIHLVIDDMPAGDDAWAREHF